MAQRITESVADRIEGLAMAGDPSPVERMVAFASAVREIMGCQGELPR